MTRLICTFTFLASFTINSVFASSFNCSFKDDKNRTGKISIIESNSKAKIKVTGLKKKIYRKGCKIKRTDMGTTYNCDRKSSDLLIHLQTNTTPMTGGIMSSKFDLFGDVNC